MFKRILVPTDGSDITAHAADTAIQLAKLHGAQLLTLSVMEPFPYAAVSEIQPVPPQEFIDAQRRVATQRVEAVSAAAAAQGL
ncbi:MAG: universal stress protein, partial [Roseateles sp.]